MKIDYQKIEKDRIKHLQVKNSDRFLNILCFYHAKGLLVTAEPPKVIRNKKIDVLDVLWAAKYEPRILEVFPAAYIHFTAKFTNTKRIPKKLKLIIEQIKRNEVEGFDYKVIKYKAMKRWSNLSLKDKRSIPLKDQKILKSFKFSKIVSEKLENIASIKGVTQTEVIENAILAQAYPARI